MLDPHVPSDAQRIVAAFLELVEAHAAVDVYPGATGGLPDSKIRIRTAFKTSVLALVSTGQLSSELRDYLEIAYVSLADYLDDEAAALLREYEHAGNALAEDRRLAREKTTSQAWRQVTDQSRLVAQVALSISAEAERLRAEFQSWHPSHDLVRSPVEDELANVRDPLV
jgi:hypothetical protein